MSDEQSAPAAVISGVDSSPQAGDHIQKVVAETVARDQENLLHHATQEAAENALSDFWFYQLFRSRRNTEEDF